MVKRLPAMRKTRVRSLGQEDPLEKEMETHSSTLAWKIPWMEEPGMLQSMGLQSRTRLSNLKKNMNMTIHTKIDVSNITLEKEDSRWRAGKVYL